MPNKIFPTPLSASTFLSKSSSTPAQAPAPTPPSAKGHPLPFLTLLLGLVVGFFYPGCTPPIATEKTADATAEAPPEASPEPGCIAPSKPCLKGCGNEIGIGKPCTRGGGECNDNLKAILCTGDFDPTDLLFCTKPCVQDADCGTNAICQRDPDNPAKGAGCAPTSCVSRPSESTTESSVEITPDAATETTAD